ncbi:MAG: NAD(P)H-hydrate dehydratase [Rhodobacteraceae bacterium]|nr:NAD(P)H-hydrate dehydratase [Paracoccaceae bacterium]
MTELLTAAQMRAIEQAAIDSGEVTGLELMERAGRGVVEAILEEWPEMALTSQKAVVLCGPGNNGGDGFVVARLLKQRGWEVEVFLYGEVAKLPVDAKVNAERWLEMGEIKDLTIDNYEKLSRPNVLIDAIFGIGLNKKLPEILIEFSKFLMGQLRKPYGFRFRKIVNIDTQSGLCSDSGKLLHRKTGGWLIPHLTVTFCMKKVGHHLEDGPFFSKKLVCKPLGLKREEFLERGLYNEPIDDRRVSLIDQKLFGKSTPFLEGQVGKHFGWNKYDCGHALILSGPTHFTGASRLAARGALRIGAGLVTIGAEAAALPEHAAQLTSIMLAELPDAAALSEKLQDKRINALCLGPGLGVDDRAVGLVDVAVRGDHAPYATVLDADALTVLSQNPDLFSALHDKCVLTPHAGEFKRLFPDIAEKLAEPATKGPAYSKVDATRDAAKRAGCIVLFKGADTVIADPQGRASINSAHYERSAPWLATAGSGDVLAGFITGLLARGFAPMQAAETAAWLHVECALKFGPGLIAEDIPEQLPAVFRDLGL